MELIEEYKTQQSWRNWQRYLENIPISPSQTVVDLGCSVGGFSNVMSKKCERVIGVDLKKEFIDFCTSNASSNQEFICSNFLDFDFGSLERVDGVWSSFSLSYLSNPQSILKRIHEVLPRGGWVALVDVSCFISGNLPNDSKHKEKVRSFEMNSTEFGVYDFDFGSKMKSVAVSSGFRILYVDDNVFDPELNFEGRASSAIVANWKARMIRMQILKTKFPDEYPEIVDELLKYLESADHQMNYNVRFVVGERI